MARSKSKSNSSSHKSSSREKTKSIVSLTKTQKLLDQENCKEKESFRGEDKSCLYSPIFNIKRKIDYKSFNRPQIEHREWFWTPYSPVITPLGLVLVSDLANSRIWQFNFCPIKNELQLIGEIKTKGRPGKMIVLKTGNIAVLIDKKINSNLIIFQGNGDILSEIEMPDLVTQVKKFHIKEEEETGPSRPKRSGSKRKSKSPSKAKKSSSKEKTSPHKSKVQSDDPEALHSKAKGLCANSDLIFIVYDNLQSMVAFQIYNKRKICVQLKNYFHDEISHFHFSSSYEFYASDKYFYACAIKSRRIKVFWIEKIKVGNIIDNLRLVFWQEMGFDELSLGYPFGIFVDEYESILVSDSRKGGIRVYNKPFWEKGPFPTSATIQSPNYVGDKCIDILQNRRYGRIFVSRNGILCTVDHFNNSIIICYDHAAFRRYDDSITNLHYRIDKRSIFDRMMSINGLDKLDLSKVICHHPCDEYVVENEDDLVPAEIKKRFQRLKEIDLEKESASKKKSSKGSSQTKKKDRSRSKSKSGSKRSKSR